MRIWSYPAKYRRYPHNGDNGLMQLIDRVGENAEREFGARVPSRGDISVDIDLRGWRCLLAYPVHKSMPSAVASSWSMLWCNPEPAK